MNKKFYLKLVIVSSMLFFLTFFNKAYSDSEGVDKFYQKIDLLVNAGTPRILKSNLLKAPSIGVINCHPGILPDFRGCTCVEWAIYLDQPIGNTVHLICLLYTSDAADE